MERWLRRGHFMAWILIVFQIKTNLILFLIAIKHTLLWNLS